MKIMPLFETKWTNAAKLADIVKTGVDKWFETAGDDDKHAVLKYVDRLTREYMTSHGHKYLQRKVFGKYGWGNTEQHDIDNFKSLVNADGSLNTVQIEKAIADYKKEYGGVNEEKENYSLWKRRNVTYRGIKNEDSPLDHEDGNGGDQYLGKGLYSVPGSNKSMARQYGTMYFLVGAKPKNPKVFNNTNDWEIWMQRNLIFNQFETSEEFYKKTDIRTEMLKLGFDGVEIKGREMVNYKPSGVKYYQNERQLQQYYDDFV